MSQPETKYMTEPKFHTFVDQVSATIKDGMFTPKEIRQAAILASII